MADTIAVLLIGFSVVGLAILLVAYLGFFHTLRKTWLGMAGCVVLCGGLAALQLEHLRNLTIGTELLHSWHYLALLFLVPQAFYFCSRDILLPDRQPAARDALHLLPLAAAALPTGAVIPATFVVGAGYSLWLARLVYLMRRGVKRFRFEMFFFGLFAVIALGVLALVVSIQWIGASTFHAAYAISIGLAVALVTAALLIFPEILSDLSEAAQLVHSPSTLKGVDLNAKLARLEGLMADDKLYRNEDLNLSLLAEAAGLSAHQLSELINRHFGVGFSRYVRERRVQEAQLILRNDARSSVLSIGMTCGFGSQSNFYAAFREVTGETPAAFRKRYSKAPSSPE